MSFINDHLRRAKVQAFKWWSRHTAALGSYRYFTIVVITAKSVMLITVYYQYSPHNLDF